MAILYCRIGDMDSYNGADNERPIGGGKYNEHNIGHEVNNFTNHDGMYYGFAQAQHSIDITKHFGAPPNAEYVDGITVIWFANNRIVGFYKDARVYRNLQHLPLKEASIRVYDDYNIMSKEAQLISKSERRFIIDVKRATFWYGNDEINKKVYEYIDNYEKRLKKLDDWFTDFSRPLEGYEKEAVIKARVNQDKFRKMLLKRYGGKCCLCGVHTPELLIASHIKPWSKCSNSEKVSNYNGLLLCPNHDKLFDAGYISFEDDGKIIISEQLDDSDRVFLNIVPLMSLKDTEGMKSFLRYHKTHIFKGNKAVSL